MAIYERTQRESAHVSSRIVDKSQVPNPLSWAALGCVTASKGELNHVYQVNTTDLLSSIFGEPSTEHISLICADKIIAEDNTMFLIRVAHENSLRGAQVVVSTEDIFGAGAKEAKGIVTDVSGDNSGASVVSGDNSIATSSLVINLVENPSEDQLKNISDDLSMDIDNVLLDGAIMMENKSVVATYRDVYQMDDKGNKTFSNELCLLLSDLAYSVEEVVKSHVAGMPDPEPLNSTQFESNWFYSDGYTMKTVIVLKASASIAENTPCDVVFSLKQTAMRAYGTNAPNKVTMPIVLTSPTE